jgi:Zn-dependent peptidase ImmA (M78 family)
MKMFGLSVPQLLEKVSQGLKTPVTEAELFATNIKLSTLKRVDKVFHKGLHYYLDPKAPLAAPESSIFFRKERFNTDLNLPARKVVTRFEDFSIALSAIAKLADLEQSRVLPLYTVKALPQQAAAEMRAAIAPDFHQDLRDHLKGLIVSLAAKNVLVFEFVEAPQQKEKANIDGFFLKPNVIVLKRQQRAFRREIFTLAHEFGHYLLGQEEVEELPEELLAQKNLSDVERWCNDFAFHFLAGDHARVLEALDRASPANDYHFDTLTAVSKATHLSTLALFTRMRLNDRIGAADYAKVKDDLEEQHLRDQMEWEKERERQKQIDEEEGRASEARLPRPIKSPLLISTIQTAFHEGVLSEFEVREKWKFNNAEFQRFFG